VKSVLSVAQEISEIRVIRGWNPCDPWLCYPWPRRSVKSVLSVA